MKRENQIMKEEKNKLNEAKMRKQYSTFDSNVRIVSFVKGEKVGQKEERAFS